MPEPSAALVAFGAVVRRLRLEQAMSQWELSERAGVHKNTPGLIERGERSPALETINAIAGALGLRGSELMRLAEEDREAGWPLSGAFRARGPVAERLALRRPPVASSDHPAVGPPGNCACPVMGGSPHIYAPAQ